ncbi:hypothetical protein KGQ20_25165 [Catenulispora sp. NF23]|uniref:sigma factor n=1 Tax=Catenulispora pinistramenti TaxID=2705254 RepID=UPI001BA82288|nr:sigma factor [Catenulispora pinistramenti]MBS2536057.1 hypothetical protein [Catenulispora pinistramenti]
MTVEEPAGFDEFVAARRPVLFRAAVLLTGDVHLAEDVLQATFMRVWLRWRSVSVMENADAYVHRVLVSVFLEAPGAPGSRQSGPDFTTILSLMRKKLTFGLVSCASSLTGEHLILVFRYASGPDVTVALNLHGCPGVSNGAVSGMFAPAGQIPPALAALGVDPAATG